ncbi:alanine--glyoxylate aminotransferase family protein [Oceanobacillus zhaokaii]|uniref:Alanine--glyoxylate aminotransferase family protein n=1 Tax=Oceanobacillus zhaokaii TaxID=2052660 RepID=A0A345PK72_9BACI|nr:alanine--glyoxylate aminotransferase family protein [Oceanobacillus zhaokaii]AXI10402.1 alanine--glyoxylate aminotransferase family protein [Oceanobacillus zhaokaii]
MLKKELLLVPGPTPVVDSIYEAMSQQTMNHTDPRFASIYKKAIEQTKKMFQTDGEVIVISGSGTLAMEMALVNTVAAGERVLVVSHGYFGDRFLNLGKAFDVEIDVIQAEWGERVSIKKVEDKLKENKYKAVTITHADTSTGVSADLDQLVPVIKRHGALVILDGVCATSAMEENMNKTYGEHGYRIDVVLTGSQKAIGVPPGLAIIAFNQSALSVRNDMEKVPAYYADIHNWIPIMNDPKNYFATPAVNLIYAYNHAMELVLNEGMENRYNRHRKYSKAIRAAISVYGMKALADEEEAATTLTCFLYPESIDDVVFRSELANKGVIVAGGLAHLKGASFRIGHMGNATKEDLEIAVKLIGETLIQIGQEADIVKAVKYFNEAFVSEAVR